MSKPSLEMLNQRILPSATPVTQPPAADAATPMVAAVDQYVHLVATVEKDIVSAVPVLGSELAAKVGYFEQQWDHLLGVTSSTPIAASLALPQPGSGSGSGGGSMTTAHDGPHPAHTNATHQSGSASGSGSGSRTTAQGTASTHGDPKVLPMSTGTGTGTGGGNGGGSGTGSVGSGTGTGYANVSGQVWLDNNGDGQIDNGEMGFQGITVVLIENPSTAPTIVGQTTTNANGDYLFNMIPVEPTPEPFEISVYLARLLHFLGVIDEP